MTILVYGAGAFGGSVGGDLVKAGEDVVLVDNVKAHVDQMNKTGLRFTGFTGDEIIPVKAILPDQIQGPLGLIFLAVKSQDTDKALDKLMPHVGPQSVIVSLQNGMNPPLIANRIGVQRTLGTSATYPADYIEPGLIMRGKKGKIYVGELDGVTTDRIKIIQRLLSFSCEAFVTQNIYGYLWSKLLYVNASAIVAMVDANNSDVFTNDKYKDLIVEAILEGVKVAEAEGIVLESLLPLLDIKPFLQHASTGRGNMYQALQDAAEADSGNLKTRSGIWRDLWVRKRRTEVPWLTGYVVKRGKALDIATPICEGVLRMIEMLENGTRHIGWENLDLLNEMMREK